MKQQKMDLKQEIVKHKLKISSANETTKDVTEARNGQT